MGKYSFFKTVLEYMYLVTFHHYLVHIGCRLLLSFCLSFHCSILDVFMKSFQVQQTMWATDWPATRRITRSPTPLPSTPRSHFCPNTPTTHNQPPRQAAAAPPHQKTPSLLRRTPQPSLNTPQCRACPPLPRGWQRTLFPKSSMSERWYRLKPLQRAHMKWPDLKLEPPYSEVVV